MIYGRELPGYPFNAKSLFTRGLIVAQRKVFGKGWFPCSDYTKVHLTWSGDETQKGVSDIIQAGKPAMIARFGSYELEATLRGMAISERIEQGLPHAIWRFLIGRSSPFWWDNSIRAGLCWNAGFFPPSDEALEKFSRLFVSEAPFLDVLTSTWPGEERLHRRYFPEVKTCGLADFSYPFFFQKPWTQSLKGKRVLFVHPCETTIRRQYGKRLLIFKKEILPEFDLLTYAPCASNCGNAGNTGFASWFDALKKMTDDIAAFGFDVAIIAAGAYGFPLAAAVKRMGRIGIQLGGATQLLFGIKGRRWDDSSIERDYYNDHWVRPMPSEVPENAETIEGGCYW